MSTSQQPSQPVRLRLTIDFDVEPTVGVGEFVQLAARLAPEVRHPSAPRLIRTFDEALAMIGLWCAEPVASQMRDQMTLIGATGTTASRPTGSCINHPAGGPPSCRDCYPGSVAV